MEVQNLDRASAFMTKDGSQIRELLSHRNSSIHNQSLAEARVTPGQTTELHFHCRAEEIYYILSGTGRMRLGDECAKSGPATPSPYRPATFIRSQTAAQRTWCFCAPVAPGYENDDTVLVDRR